MLNRRRRSRDRFAACAASAAAVVSAIELPKPSAAWKAFGPAAALLLALCCRGVHPGADSSLLGLAQDAEVAAKGGTGASAEGFGAGFGNYSEKRKEVKGAREVREVDEDGFRLDGYDYQKHMAEMGSGTFVASSGEVDRDGGHFFRVSLPAAALASETMEDRLLESVTLDPNLMEMDTKLALEEAADDAVAAEPEIGLMDDDFMDQLLTAEAGSVAEPGFDFEAHVARLMAAAEGGGDDSDGEMEDDEAAMARYEARKARRGGAGLDDDEEEASLVASLMGMGVADVRPARNVDEHLEAVMADYDDDELGELEEAEYDCRVGGISELDSTRKPRSLLARSAPNPANQRAVAPAPLSPRAGRAPPSAERLENPRRVPRWPRRRRQAPLLRALWVEAPSRSMP